MRAFVLPSMSIEKVRKRWMVWSYLVTWWCSGELQGVVANWRWRRGRRRHGREGAARREERLKLADRAAEAVWRRGTVGRWKESRGKLKGLEDGEKRPSRNESEPCREKGLMWQSHEGEVVIGG